MVYPLYYVAQNGEHSQYISFLEITGSRHNIIL